MATLKMETYLNQFVETATKGNVDVEYAHLQHRMRLYCGVCKTQLTLAMPIHHEVDYGLQEFVKIHAHIGGHNDPVKAVAPMPITPSPVTLDFKKVPKTLKTTGRRFR